VSYVLITAFLTLHAIGAHYTYAEVPFGFWL
jgi:putative membrane protein